MTEVQGIDGGERMHLNLFLFFFNLRGPTEDIISYFTLMSSEIHYYDIIEEMGSWTLMSSEV